MTSHRGSIGIIDLPRDILLHIVQELIELETQERYQSALFESGNFSSLKPLSMTHSILRHACIAAGMFKRVMPSTDLTAVVDSRKYTKSLLEGYGRSFLTSLIIDLSNSKVWRSCAVIMGVCPFLAELGFTKSLCGKLKQFQESGLRMACTEFKGNSLTLDEVMFTKSSLAILDSLRDTITSISLNRSGLHISDANVAALKLPLLPDLQKVRFVGTMFNTKTGQRVSQFRLLRACLMNSKITHFEFFYGYPSGQKQGISIPKPCKGSFIREEVIMMLRLYCHSCLKVFLNGDQIDPQLLEIGGLLCYSSTPNVAFLRMRLLIFRTDDVFSFTSNEVIKQKAPPWECLYTSNEPFAWDFLIGIFLAFESCDCLLIETKLGTNPPSKDWWCTAAEKLAHIQYKNVSRFFIVGNRNNGFAGIDFKDESWRVPSEGRTYMDNALCEAILFERL
jgi:hypothetical protein